VQCHYPYGRFLIPILVWEVSSPEKHNVIGQYWNYIHTIGLRPWAYTSHMGNALTIHKHTYLSRKGDFCTANLDSAGWRFVAVVGYLMLIFSCIPTFWQTKISICRSAHSLFVSLRCIHCALLCKSYVCWHSCRCFKTPLSQSGRALVSSDSQSSPTSHTSVSHTIAVKLLPQRVAGHHRSYSSPTEPDR